ncbi:hypothetical protein B0F90DRAFT_131071 [Multifurca ochricompacta]|uniref:Uncharacterized protein n=1 Tax=Multifurca ochricompacta TaxID=376703 RepID=A0AAD4MGQ3_9AGAM|nr:hypothetical protein B0F90DRAFT_131071 [Multifurca ochricompacta]
MSTRVQKGGTIFKPVANARSHGAHSRTSATPESKLSRPQGDNRHDIQSGAAPRFAVVVPSLPLSTPNAQPPSQMTTTQEFFDFTESNSAEMDSLGVSHTQFAFGAPPARLRASSRPSSLPIRSLPTTEPIFQKREDISHPTEELDTDHASTLRPDMQPPLVVSLMTSPPSSLSETSPPLQTAGPSSSAQTLWLPLQIQSNLDIPVSASLTSSSALSDSNIREALRSQSAFPFDFSILAEHATQATTDLHTTSREDSETLHSSHMLSSHLQSNGTGVSILESSPPLQQKLRNPTPISQKGRAVEQPSSPRTRQCIPSDQPNDSGPVGGPSEVDIPSNSHRQPLKKRVRKSLNESADLGPGAPPVKRLSRNSSRSEAPQFLHWTLTLTREKILTLLS